MIIRNIVLIYIRTISEMFLLVKIVHDKVKNMFTKIKFYNINAQKNIKIVRIIKFKVVI